MEATELTDAHDIAAADLVARGIETAVTTERAASLLGLSRKTLYQWAELENGPIRPVRFGRRRLLWRVADLQKVAAQTEPVVKLRERIRELDAPMKAVWNQRARLETKHARLEMQRVSLNDERSRLDAEQSRLDDLYQSLTAKIEATSKVADGPIPLTLGSSGVAASLTTEECAIALGLRPQTLRKWACKEDGPIRPVRVGRRLAWSVADVRALLAGVVEKK
jgi:excisionase family DNA binding protein